MSLNYLFSLQNRIRRGLETVPDDWKERHAAFLRSRQRPDGGFGGRTQSLTGEAFEPDDDTSDLYYAAFAVRGLVALDRFDRSTAEKTAAWLETVRPSPLNVIDLVSHLYLSLVLQTIHGIEVGGALEVAISVDSLETLRREDGGYAKSVEGHSSSTYHSFLAVLARQLTGKPLVEPDRLAMLILNRQRDDGGFVEIAPMRRGGTNPTAAAVAVLEMLGQLTPIVRDDVRGFLGDVATREGGYLANSRIPFPDGLSTFTGLVTEQTVGGPPVVEPSRMRRFIQGLEQPEGGFLAADWDREADVEYTFYGLGVLGLLNAGR